eukprot:TRINITY_DN6555_c0_g1_i10.p2 TRINITY_DN6555_c0_g1~~TRINITY_DN6555_c0_g1_i10.p2  ORF type:complete len:168 (-),score=54.50 TRINITY_DN6555_c0_g1_i10:1233-1736(-)
MKATFQTQKENIEPLGAESTQASEQGDRSVQELSENHKKNIRFQCSSFERRNIDKAIVRALSTLRREVRAKIFENYQLLNIERNKYNEIGMAIDSFNSQIKKHRNKRTYAHMMNWMISDKAHRIVLENCLEEKQKMILQTECHKVKRKNQSTYLKTLEDYLNYIKSL